MIDTPESGPAAVEAAEKINGQSDVTAPLAPTIGSPNLNRPVKYNRKNKIRTAFDYAARTIAPWSNELIDRLMWERPYEGRSRELVRLFGYRVTVYAIRKWRAGSRKPPRWAIDVVMGELRQIENRAREARERLESGS
jgi:hypothetical protein